MNCSAEANDDTNAKSQDGKNNNNEEEEDEEDHIGSAVFRARAAGASIKSDHLPLNKVEPEMYCRM